MRTTAIATAIAAPLLLTGALALHASAASQDAEDRGGSTLRYDVRFSPFELVDVGAQGFSNGDEIVFHDQLLRAGRPVGDELGSCVVVDQSAALTNCTMVIRLPGGRITAQFDNAPPPRKPLAITGGTGRYRAAAGEGLLVERGDQTGTLTLHLAR